MQRLLARSISSNCTIQYTAEPHFSEKYLYHKKKEIYCCVVCGNPLFSSEIKYDFGSAKPSFTDILHLKLL